MTLKWHWNGLCVLLEMTVEWIYATMELARYRDCMISSVSGCYKYRGVASMPASNWCEAWWPMKKRIHATQAHGGGQVLDKLKQDLGTWPMAERIYSLIRLAGTEGMGDEEMRRGKVRLVCPCPSPSPLELPRHC